MIIRSPERQKRKIRHMKNEKDKKRGFSCALTFLPQSSDPNLSQQKMGNTSVMLILNCKSSLSLIHIKCSLTLDTATSAISGCIDNARLPASDSDIKTQSLNCSLVTFYVVREFDILLR